MKLTLNIGASPLRRWHLDLIDRLRAVPELELSMRAPAGHGTGPQCFANTACASKDPPQSELFAIAPAGTGLPPHRPASVAADLVLDLDETSAVGDARSWQLHFDGQTGENALVAAVLAGRMPLVEVMANGTLVAAGRPGSENNRAPQMMLDDILSRLVTLIVAAVRGQHLRVPALPAVAEPPPAPASRSGFVQSTLKTALSAAADRFYRRWFHAPHWRTGWRKLDGPDLFDLQRHPASGWRVLPDDGTRFYADPFPIEHRGRVTLFVEDFVHAVGKGIISAVEFGPDGPLGTPVPVMEQPGHLSYPFVFERDGEVWMIPESCSAGRIDLFRATAFPGGWVRETTLIDNVVASDATLVEHGGLWWLFATVRDGGGSYSDALHLWSAPDFRGPWTPHPGNPVLIDIASARPAGRMVLREGALLRPVQDCRLGYGKALGIARVTRLDGEGFSQEIETILRPGKLWPGRRLHSLNSAGGLEFIDGSGLARKPLIARR